MGSGKRMTMGTEETASQTLKRMTRLNFKLRRVTFWAPPISRATVNDPGGHFDPCRVPGPTSAPGKPGREAATELEAFTAVASGCVEAPGRRGATKPNYGQKPRPVPARECLAQRFGPPFSRPNWRGAAHT